MDYSVFIGLALGTAWGFLAIWWEKRKRAPHGDR